MKSHLHVVQQRAVANRNHLATIKGLGLRPHSEVWVKNSVVPRRDQEGPPPRHRRRGFGVTLRPAKEEGRKVMASTLSNVRKLLGATRGKIRRSRASAPVSARRPAAGQKGQYARNGVRREFEGGQTSRAPSSTEAPASKPSRSPTLTSARRTGNGR